MTTTPHSRRRLGALALLLAFASACGRKGAPAATTGTEAIRLGKENVTIAEVRALKSGPVISGALTAERQATIRAETGGTVLELYADQGQSVARDQKLAKLDDNVIRDSYDRPGRASGPPRWRWNWPSATSSGTRRSSMRGRFPPATWSRPA